MENKSKLKPTSAIVTSISGKERSRSKSGEKKLKVSNTSAAGNNKVSVKTPIVTKKSCVSNNNVINIEKIKSPKSKLKKPKKSSSKETLENNYINYDQSQNRYQDGMDEEQQYLHMNNLKISSQVMDKNYQNNDNNLKNSNMYTNNNQNFYNNNNSNNSNNSNNNNNNNINNTNNSGNILY